VVVLRKGLLPRCLPGLELPDLLLLLLLLLLLSLTHTPSVGEAPQPGLLPPPLLLLAVRA
jgi:hypothetical protein